MYRNNVISGISFIKNIFSVTISIYFAQFASSGEFKNLCISGGLIAKVTKLQSALKEERIHSPVRQEIELRKREMDMLRNMWKRPEHVSNIFFFY
jgi:hypothetical protein